MAQKRFFKLQQRVAGTSLLLQSLTLSLLLVISSASLADDGVSITLNSDKDFKFTEQDSAVLLLRPLDDSLRQLEGLAQTQSLGVVNLGQIKPLGSGSSVTILRNLAAQIAQTLQINFNLIGDSESDQALAPHHLLLLYNEHVNITLALTKQADSEHYQLIASYAVSEASKQPAQTN